jgi:hypothetical protein
MVLKTPGIAFFGANRDTGKTDAQFLFSLLVVAYSSGIRKYPETGFFQQEASPLADPAMPKIARRAGLLQNMANKRHHITSHLRSTSAVLHFNQSQV